MLASVLLLIGLVPMVHCQRLGLPIHKFFTNPFVRYSRDDSEIPFAGSEIHRLTLPHPVLFGPSRVAYTELFLHKGIPGFVFFKNPNDFPPDVEVLYSKPHIKVLNEFRNRNHGEIKFYARSASLGAGAGCVDRKFGNRFKDTANQVFRYPTTGYFSPQSIVSITFRRPAGQAMGSLAEIVFVSSGSDTVVFLNYGGIAALEDHSAGFFDEVEGAGSLSLPPGFVEQTNLAEAGCWAFRISDPNGVASANVDQSMRRILDMNAQAGGFLSDRLLGCPCSQCDSRAQCVNIGSGSMRVAEGFAKCCRCQGLNAFLGNGMECSDTGTPLPVSYTSISNSRTDGSIQVNATVVQAKLDLNIHIASLPSNPSLTEQTMTLAKISEAVWGNLALLTASSNNELTQNLFALGSVFHRKVELTASDKTGTVLAVWTIRQTIWNAVMLKATNTSISIQSFSNALDGGVMVIILNDRYQATRYEFTTIQGNLLRLESRPAASYNLTILPKNPSFLPIDLRLEFADTWEFEPSCRVENRVEKLLLERVYDLTDESSGVRIAGLTGNLTRLQTCDKLNCGVGAECAEDGPKGQARCRCLDGYSRDGVTGPCKPVCSLILCDTNAECILNKCTCLPGFSGDGLSCSADPRDCRLPQASCRPEDVSACLQHATVRGVQFRCQCSSNKCIREADAACHQEAGCSRFAICQPGMNGNIGTCSCRSGFRGNGTVCLPEVCVDNVTCADAGPYPFCNASRVCDSCPPPNTIAAGRCQARPCKQSDCWENAQCDPVSNACVCKSGFAANRQGACGIVCRSVQDCNKDILAVDLEILNATMECLAGVCQCRQGFTVDRLDQTAMTLTCTNCASDLNCLRGATCQSDVRLSGARTCKCPTGKVGDGKTACNECEPGRPAGSSPLACSENAECQHRTDGMVCRCQHGYSSVDPKTVTCVKEDTLLSVGNDTEIRLYEGQTDQEVTCRVLRGPVRPNNLIWTSIRGIPLPAGDGSRVTQYVLNERKVLRFSRIVKPDAKEYFCMPDIDSEFQAALSINMTVLDNPCPQCHSLAFCNYSRPGCQCNRGYSGDGVNRCDKASCTEQALCDPATELCLFNQVEGKFACECVPGMERLQGRCQRRQEACTPPNAGCHVNAECALVDGRRQCRCREGFSGDGKLRCDAAGPGCNFFNRCVKNSECKYSQVDSKYRCVCSTGYFGNGDTECRSQASCPACALNSGICDQQTVEHRSVDGRMELVQLVVCTCPPGSFEVKTAAGATLCRTGAQMNRTLFVAQGDAILQMPADSSQTDSRDATRKIFIAMSSASAAAEGPGAVRPGSPVVALDYNCHRKQLVWSVYGHSKLYIASTADAGKGGPASSSWMPFGEGMEMVEGLAVDWQTDNVYYTAQYVSPEEATRGERFGEIGVISYRQGVQNKKVLFRGPKDGVVRPRGIAVDPFLGKFYYVDWDRADPRIMMASMNGANHVKLCSTDGALPNDVVRRFDSRNEEVCFATATLPLNGPSIDAAARLETALPQTVVQCVWRPIPGAAYVERGSVAQVAWSGVPFGLAYSDGGEFYWTNWLTNRLVEHNVNSNRTFVRGPLGSLDNRLMGVTVADASCPVSGYSAQTGEHPCADSRGYGDCKYICLAAPNQGVDCVCPDSDPKCNPHVNRPTDRSPPNV